MGGACHWVWLVVDVTYQKWGFWWADHVAGRDLWWVGHVIGCGMCWMFLCCRRGVSGWDWIIQLDLVRAWHVCGRGMSMGVACLWAWSVVGGVCHWVWLVVGGLWHSQRCPSHGPSGHSWRNWPPRSVRCWPMACPSSGGTGPSSPFRSQTPRHGCSLSLGQCPPWPAWRVGSGVWVPGPAGVWARLSVSTGCWCRCAR